MGDNVEWEDILKGTIGFETFKTAAIIDDFRTAPIEDIKLELYWASNGGK